MTDDRSGEEQNADAREYEPPALRSLGSVAELTEMPATRSSLDF